MISRLNASLLLGFLLLISLAIKVPGSLSQYEIAADDVIGRVADFLKRNGLETEPYGSDLDMFSISAKAGECRILVAVLSPQGWHREVIKKIAPDGSRVLFLYDGRVYEDQPVLLTRVHDYWNRFLHHLGSNSSQPPVLGIAETSECLNRNIPWTSLSTSHS